MSAPILTEAQQAAIEDAEDDIENGFMDGYKKPDLTESIPKLEGYEKSKDIKGIDYSGAVKVPFKSIFAAIARHLDSLDPITLSDSSLSNGWIYDTGADYNLPGYRKDAQGTVHLQGKLSGGSAGDVFALPAGYRPDHIETIGGYGVISSGIAAVAVTISTTGTVSVSFTPGVTSFSLDGISFRAAL